MSEVPLYVGAEMALPTSTGRWLKFCSESGISKVNFVRRMGQMLPHHHVYVVLARWIENVPGHHLRHFTGLSQARNLKKFRGEEGRGGV